jgi:hypothetical protein
LKIVKPKTMKDRTLPAKRKISSRHRGEELEALANTPPQRSQDVVDREDFDGTVTSCSLIGITARRQAEIG